MAEHTAGREAESGEPAEELAPILTAHLFAQIERLLIELLSTLAPADWERPTLAPEWTVKDVAAHLLDTQLRKLSIGRDGHFSERPQLASPADLVWFIDRLNREGVTLHRRLSPAVLISLLKVTASESSEYHQSLDPFGRARFAVSWAGEAESRNWFDTAREYTERWHHQQQIRLAVDRPGTSSAQLASRYALGSQVIAAVTGTCAERQRLGDWSRQRAPSQWGRSASRRRSPGGCSQRASIDRPPQRRWPLGEISTWPVTSSGCARSSGSSRRHSEQLLRALLRGPRAAQPWCKMADNGAPASALEVGGGGRRGAGDRATRG